jgi:hypothetical protein
MNIHELNKIAWDQAAAEGTNPYTKVVSPEQIAEAVQGKWSFYSAKQNTPQLAARVPSMGQNLSRRRKFRNAPSACGGDRNFQGFASLLERL